MTLYAGSNATGRTKLDGPERMLDALIGTIVWLVGLVIGYLAIDALYGYGTALSAQTSDDALSFGFAIAVFGGGIIYGIATLIFLVRLATGRRSWSAPLWGAILASGSIVIGYFIMSSAI